MRTGGKLNKKIGYIALRSVLVMLVMVGLAACGGAAATPTTVPVAPTATTAPAPPTSTTVPTEAPELEATPTSITQSMDGMEEVDDMEGMEEATPTAPANDGAATDQPAPTPTVATPANTDNAATTTINAILKEWALDLDQTEVSAGTITFIVTNEGRMQHNLTVVSSSGSTLGATPNFSGSAGPQSLEVSLEPGTYTIYCSLPGHAARGQTTTLIVK
jgi:plastocyanin